MHIIIVIALVNLAMLPFPLHISYYVCMVQMRLQSRFIPGIQAVRREGGREQDRKKGRGLRYAVGLILTFGGLGRFRH